VESSKCSPEGERYSPQSSDTTETLWPGPNNVSLRVALGVAEKLKAMSFRGTLRAEESLFLFAFKH
jgi:hypothetical protein